MQTSVLSEERFKKILDATIEKTDLQVHTVSTSCFPTELFLRPGWRVVEKND